MAPQVQVKGAPELARALEKASKDQAKAVAASNRKVARYARDRGRDRAQSGTRQQRRMAGGIGSRASKNDARLSVKNTRGAPGATSTFWGTKRNTGWNKPGSPPNNPAWVGDSWTVAEKNGGPYVINEMLADELPAISDMHLQGAFDAIEIPPAAR